MAFEMKQITVDPVHDEDDMVSTEDLSYSKDDFLQLLEIEQYQDNCSIQNGVMVIQPTENIQSGSSLEEDFVNDDFLCLICNVSYPSQLILEKHLRTHDDTFFSIDSDIIIEPHDLFRPPPYLDFIEDQHICTTQLLCNEDMQVYIEENLHTEQLRNFTSCNGNNDQTNSIDVMRPVVCSLGDEIIHDAKNYYSHCDDMHNEKSSSESEKLLKPEEPSSPERIEKTFKKLEQEVIEDKSEDEYEETMENVQDVRTENEQQLKTNYNTEKYQMLLNKLVFKSYFTGRINRAKLIGPYFWKSSLLKEELVQYIQPKQFQGKLKLVKCKTCVKVFARPIQCSKSCVPNPPIDMQLMENKKCNNNNGNDAVNNDDETWKITCQECSLVYHTLYEYCAHVHRHSNYSDHCNACLFDAVGN